jgi:hypothetical protein
MIWEKTGHAGGLIPKSSPSPNRVSAETPDPIHTDFVLLIPAQRGLIVSEAADWWGLGFRLSFGHKSSSWQAPEAADRKRIKKRVALGRPKKGY